MLTLVQKSKIYERVNHFVALGNEKFESDLDIPHVRFDKRGTTAGTAHYEMLELNFNARLLIDNWDEFMNQTIPHEVAHLLKNHIHGRGKGSFLASHGVAWKRVMRGLGVEPDRCHAMDVSKVQMPKAKHIYTCDKCQKELVISSVRHNKMVRGKKNYVHCRGHGLTHKKALGKMTITEAMDQKTPAFMQQEVNKPAPKSGTKIAHAMIVFEAMVVDGVRSCRQDVISAMSNSMQITKQQAAGYFQTCKKRAA